jgi:hypothetical protein
MGGRDSSVGINDLPQAEQSGDRIPVGARFPTPHHTVLGAHSASSTMDMGSLCPEAKRPAPGVDHPPPSRAEV